MDECDQQLETLSTLVSTNESHLNKLTNHLDNHQTEEEEGGHGPGRITAATWQMVM